MNPATEPETTSPPPHQSMTATQTVSQNQQQSQTELFGQLENYPFDSDREFAAGLAIILGHPETPASPEEIARDDDLVLQAKCYYFTRKENLEKPLNVANYKSWLDARRPRPSSIDRPRDIDHSQASATGLSGNMNQVPEPAAQEPSYPTSFAHIVELITTGQPVPGIQQIPDTLLTGQGAASVKPKRSKPWEKGEAA
ncbi:hypothetical protein BDV18DRAFT_148786 [Aspergillus unguis]